MDTCKKCNFYGGDMVCGWHGLTMDDTTLICHRFVPKKLTREQQIKKAVKATQHAMKNR
jgi:hypothetical protein